MGLQNYLNNLDSYVDGYESMQGPMAKTGVKSDPLGRNNLQPAAQFTIRVRRNSINIANGILPVALFGWQKYLSQYNQELSNQNVLPTATTGYDGVVGGITSAPNASDLVFSYTDGVNTDTLTVSCDENPYTEVLGASAFAPMLIQKIRMSLSDETQNSQFQQGIQVLRSTIFGKTTRQTIVPSTQKSPLQFQAGIVDLIDYPMTLDSSTFLIVPVLAVASFEVAFSFEVQAYSRPLEA